MSAQRASQLVEAGLWLRLSGDHEGAKRLFEQALKLDPTNARARQLLDSPPPAAAQPAGAAKQTMDLDWGLATGRTPTPPPVPPVAPPVIKSSTRPFGEGAPPGTHTVRLGEASAPEIPEAPRFEDPHGEVMITGADTPPPENSTLVFGMSGVPVPPVPSSGGAPQSGTLVFGGAAAKGGPTPSAEPRPQTTMVFSGRDAPPAVPPVSSPAGGGTMVFGGTKEPALAVPQGVPPSTTRVFGATKDSAPQGGTLVFGSGGRGAPPPAPAREPAPEGSTLVYGSGTKEPEPGSGTMVFGGTKGAPQAAAPATPNSTMVFGSSGSAPPSIAPVAPQQNSTLTFGSSPREQAVTTEPGLPPFAEEPEPEPEREPPPPVPTSGTLQFNFDDMVPTQGPVSSPPVPSEKDDQPQTAWDRSNPRIDISQIQPGEGGGFDLISTPAPAPKPRSPAQLREEVATLLSGAKDLLDLDDHSGAMELINKALELDPSDAAALKLKDRSERTLQAMFESKLGDLSQLPRVKLKEDEIIWLNLDHRAGFVLAQIDGAVTFEDLFAVSGMSRLDTARILAQLVEEGVISKG